MSETIRIRPNQYVNSTFGKHARMRSSKEELTKAASSKAPSGTSEEILALVQHVFLNPKRTVHAVVVSGVSEGNGSSYICAAVAYVLAQNVGSVCLVEADLHKPELAEQFGMADRRVLANCLESDEPITSFLSCVDGDRLFLLPSGAFQIGRFLLLADESFEARMKELRQQFRFVIVCAPLASSIETMLLGKLVDGVLLVIEANRTRRDSASTVVEFLRSANVNILAAVLNNQTFPIPKIFESRL